MHSIIRPFKWLVPRSLRRIWREHQARRFVAEYSNLAVEDVFDRIYAENRWCSLESRSGPGSELDATVRVRTEIAALAHRLSVRSLLDVPCGDFNWMREVHLENCQYIGGDIVRQLVERNQQCYGSPSRRFMHCDLIRSPLPAVDLILCRDCLIHLSFEHGLQAIRNIKSSGARYLLTTTHPQVLHNHDIVTGAHRLINLCQPPYSFPAPIELIVERPWASSDAWDSDKSLVPFPVDQLRAHAASRR